MTPTAKQRTSSGSSALFSKSPSPSVADPEAVAAHRKDGDARASDEGGADDDAADESENPRPEEPRPSARAAPPPARQATGVSRSRHSLALSLPLLRARARTAPFPTAPSPAYPRSWLQLISSGAPLLRRRQVGASVCNANSVVVSGSDERGHWHVPLSCAVLSSLSLSLAHIATLSQWRH